MATNKVEQGAPERREGLEESGQVSLSREDTSEILADQDQTAKHARLGENIETQGPLSGSLEDEPIEFMQGEIDVKAQMDRTTRVVDADILGHHDLDDSPAMTPGGIEEVAAKTDEDIARRRASKHFH